MQHRISAVVFFLLETSLAGSRVAVFTEVVGVAAQVRSTHPRQQQRISAVVDFLETTRAGPVVLVFTMVAGRAARVPLFAVGSSESGLRRLGSWDSGQHHIHSLLVV